MNKYKHSFHSFLKIIPLAAVMLMATGCSNFLEEESQDEVIPSSASDLEQILIGEGYQMSSSLMPYLDMMTDDVMSNYTESANQQAYVKAGQAPFIWEKQLFERMKEQDISNYNTWSGYYSLIKGCNVALDMIDDATGSDSDKGNVKGQALALRGYYYFMLANLFAKPYNAEGIDRDTEPCVPLILKSDVTDDYPTRNTITEVYDQIEKDLLAAGPLMEAYGTGNNKNKVTDQFVHMLLCRLYLYEERYDDCIRQADIVLAKQPGLLKIANYATRSSSGFYTMHVYHPDSPELIWCYSSDTENTNFEGVCNGSDTPAFIVSNDLKSLYDYHKSARTNKGDMRLSFFFTTYNVGSMKWDPTLGTFVQNTDVYWGCHNYNSGDASKGFRTAEAYLNRAESYIRKFQSEGKDAYRVQALADLNTLRESRWDGTYTPVDITDADSLWTFYTQERRRELAFDDHRWFDLRRFGMPRITHTFELTKGQPIEYVLEKNDSRYVLEIPQEAITRNPSLKQNP